MDRSTDRKVSVALATFNGATYLAEQLQSIAGQTLVPAELVVCDDGSDDQTIEILQKFAQTAAFPVHVHRNPVRLGFRGNFMRCATLCAYELIAFSDQDDVWMSCKLAKQASDFCDESITLSCHNADLIDSNGVRLGRRLDQFPHSCRLNLKQAGPVMFPRGFTQMIRRDIVKWHWLHQRSVDYGDLAETMSHDGWFFLLALLQGDIRYRGEPLVYHRQHNSNTSEPVWDKRARFRSKFSTRSAEFRRLIRVWTNRSEMLQALASEELDVPTQARIQEATVKYKRAAAAAEHRSHFYATKSSFRKAQSFARAFCRGDYKPNDPWRFPLQGAAKDIIYIFRDTRSEGPNQSND